MSGNLKTSPGQLDQNKPYNFTDELKKNGVDVATVNDLGGLPVLYKTGGGELSANRTNVLNDGDTGYLFPLDSSVTVGTPITISNPLSANAGVVTTQSTDTVEVDAVSDTSITFVGAASVTFASTGAGIWRQV